MSLNLSDMGPLQLIRSDTSACAQPGLVELLHESGLNLWPLSIPQKKVNQRLISLCSRLAYWIFMCVFSSRYLHNSYIVSSAATVLLTWLQFKSSFCHFPNLALYQSQWKFRASDSLFQVKIFYPCSLVTCVALQVSGAVGTRQPGNYTVYLLVSHKTKPIPGTPPSNL